MVKLICYNIEYCEGIKGHWYEYLKVWRIFHSPKNLDKKIIAKLKQRKPDILALVEFDLGSIRVKKQNELELFEKNLKLKNAVKRVKYSLKGWKNIIFHFPIIRMQANAILSKYKFNHVKYHYLKHGFKRLLIEAEIKIKNKNLTLILAHLALTKKTRKKQLDEIIRIVKKIKTPIILMGDFNINNEHELDKLFIKTKLKDSSTTKPKTFPSWKPKKRFDYVLSTKDIIIKNYKTLNYKFSDHKPLLVEFEIKK